jgi:hypothetical protein
MSEASRVENGRSGVSLPVGVFVFPCCIEAFFLGFLALQFIHSRSVLKETVQFRTEIIDCGQSLQNRMPERTVVLFQILRPRTGTLHASLRVALTSRIW